MNYEYKQLLRHKERVKHGGGGGLEATRKAATLAEFRAVVEQECPFVVADTVQDWETTEEKRRSPTTPPTNTNAMAKHVPLNSMLSLLLLYCRNNQINAYPVSSFCRTDCHKHRKFRYGS
jgi:hypothetical protein